jgi:hypothetical protein
MANRVLRLRLGRSTGGSRAGGRSVRAVLSPSADPAARSSASDHATMTSHSTTARQTITYGKVVLGTDRRQLPTDGITTDGGAFRAD